MIVDRKRKPREYREPDPKQPRFKADSHEKWRRRWTDRYRRFERQGIPEKRTPRHILSISGNYAHQLNWARFNGTDFGKGSKLGAYRYARGITASHNGQPITCPLATPKGFLP